MKLPHALYVIQKIRVAWWSIFRPLTLGVKGLVRDEAGNVLLVKHTYMPGWHIPGGRVEKGESIEQAALREVREETGLDLEGCPARLLGVYYNTNEHKHDHIALFVIYCSAPPKPTPRLFEIEDCRFFGRTEIPADATPATVRRLKECFNATVPDARW